MTADVHVTGRYTFVFSKYTFSVANAFVMGRIMLATVLLAVLTSSATHRVLSRYGTKFCDHETLYFIQQLELFIRQSVVGFNEVSDTLY